MFVFPDVCHLLTVGKTLATHLKGEHRFEQGEHQKASQDQL